MATLVFAGLRISEACALRWRDVDLGSGRITVRASKTGAGVRQVNVLPALRDELACYRPADADPDSYVFTTASGTPRDKDNANKRVIVPVIERGDELLAERDLAPLPEGITAHKLRHTFASLLSACGEDPAYAMDQIGHSDPRFTLRVYTHSMSRRDGERERLRALVEGADWARMGTSARKEGSSAASDAAPETTESPDLRGIQGVATVSESSMEPLAGRRQGRMYGCSARFCTRQPHRRTRVRSFVDLGELRVGEGIAEFAQSASSGRNGLSA